MSFVFGVIIWTHVHVCYTYVVLYLKAVQGTTVAKYMLSWRAWNSTYCSLLQLKLWVRSSISCELLWTCPRNQSCAMTSYCCDVSYVPANHWPVFVRRWYAAWLQVQACDESDAAVVLTVDLACRSGIPTASTCIHTCMDCDCADGLQYSLVE